MERRFIPSVVLLSLTIAMGAHAMPLKGDMPMPEQRPSRGPSTCGEPDESSANGNAEDCETEFIKAQADCNSTKTAGVQSDYTCDISSGEMNKPPLEMAQCKLRQADEYDAAAKRCIDLARAAKDMCNKSQNCVIKTDNGLTAKKIEEGKIQNAVSAQPATGAQSPSPQAAPPVENKGESGVTANTGDSPKVGVSGVNSPNHVATKSTPATGLKSLPELVSANNSIHDSWHKADALESGPAQEMKQHAQQLRAEAANLQQQAANNTGATTAPPPAATKASPAPANQNPQAANPQQQQPQAPAAAPALTPAAAQPTTAATTPVSAFDQTASSSVNNADIISPAALLPGEGTSASVLDSTSAMGSSGSVSTFDPGLSMPLLEGSKNAGTASASSASSSSSSLSGSIKSAGDSGGVVPAKFGDGRAPASVGSSSGGGGGGGRYSYGSSTSDKFGRGMAGAIGSDGKTAGGSSDKVDLSQFLPSGGAARASAMAAMGIHGAHVNFFSKVNERYHSLEGSLEP